MRPRTNLLDLLWIPFACGFAVAWGVGRELLGAAGDLLTRAIRGKERS
jgi:hypothetical protein